ncbi:Bug family tripartite tricarboxylate transporter substrate binding protein [Rhodoplanes sp. Z2-YC6860]|uniref:Bug family tripartite tricarboxylate transporter substrate binding protein n=1 Tax=Rhodoplanes sp. Z2-YC6860 TaxID=674703 RepID=UPI00078CEDB7|nr:tripartite tricarboxylate transporter substrate binding protein [Rhodoplanes sp. Z2-YC6860]AMN43185.1 TTT family tricarboxylate transporter, receptor protein [Rhodoplanes sp. Z2-YC6860]
MPILDRTVSFFGAALIALACCLPAAADDYPTHPITLIIPFPAGGGVDTVGRVIAAKLTTALGQQVVVENRAGAGSVVGIRAGAKAPPDGYTILMITTGASAPTNPGYDIFKDFAPIGLIAAVPIMIQANPATPVNSLTDLIALAKKEPGKLTVGTPPPPTLNYFGIELFKSLTGADVTTVTYKGTGPLTNDLVGGHVMLAFNTVPPAIGNIQSGRIKAIAVCAPERLAVAPDVPTAAEAGLPGLDVVLYYGLLAPAGTPQAIVERLNAELRKIVDSDDVKSRMISDGGAAMPSTPEEYARNIEREEGKWRTLIDKLGLKIE